MPTTQREIRYLTTEELTRLRRFAEARATQAALSRLTKKTDAAKLQQTTVQWGGRHEPFQGFSDWRLHLAGIGVLTMLAYWWLW